MNINHFTARFPSPPQNYPKAMHTNTFQSRFKVGDKITDGTQTINIKTVGLNAIRGVYYIANDGYIYYENYVTNYRLAPRYAVGEKVWYNTSSGIREDIVTDSCDNGIYQIQNSLLDFTLKTNSFPPLKLVAQELRSSPSRNERHRPRLANLNHPGWINAFNDIPNTFSHIIIQQLTPPPYDHR